MLGGLIGSVASAALGGLTGGGRGGGGSGGIMPDFSGTMDRMRSNHQQTMALQNLQQELSTEQTLKGMETTSVVETNKQAAAAVEGALKAGTADVTRTARDMERRA